MSYYLATPIVKYYYEQLKKNGSLDNAVDSFWKNCLPSYFTQAKMYGIELEQRSMEGIIQQRADSTIRYIRRIKNDDLKNTVFLEDRPGGLETQSSAWSHALQQLTRYLKLVRTEQDTGCILYGNVTIGTHCRFYVPDPLEQTMRDFVGQDAQDVQEEPLELEKDEAAIHTILNQWVALTSQ